MFRLGEEVQTPNLAAFIFDVILRQKVRLAQGFLLLKVNKPLHHIAHNVAQKDHEKHRRPE